MRYKINEKNIWPSSNGVYLISFNNTKKCYIGSAAGFNPKNKNANGFYRRWIKHIHLLKNNKHHSKALQSAFNKYGEDNLFFKVLEVCEPLNCIEKEQFYIDKFNSFNKGYNCRPIAKSNLGYKPTEIHKKKLSTKYEVERDKISKEVIELYNNNKTTREISEMLKISRGVITKIFKKENITPKTTSTYTKKKLYQYDLKHNLIKEWDSIKDCCDTLSINKNSIRQVLNGKAKQAKGFYFSLVLI